MELQVDRLLFLDGRMQLGAKLVLTFAHLASKESTIGTVTHGEEEKRTA